MAVALKEQREKMARFPFGDHRADCRKIRLCELLIERIKSDDYDLELEGYKPALYTGKVFYSEYMSQQDVTLLFKILGKYLRHWWV